VLCKTANIIFVFPFAPIANSVMAFPPLSKRGKKREINYSNQKRDEICWHSLARIRNTHAAQ